MPSFTPGRVIKEFTTKKGQRATLTYPKWEDLEQLLSYINTLSTEDTYISFSGEQQSLEDEAKFFGEVFSEMEVGKRLMMFCFVEGQLAGVSHLESLEDLRLRGTHVRRFGLSVAQPFRGDGIGYELARGIIEEGIRFMPEMKKIILECFSNNEVAFNLYKKLGFVEVGRLPGLIHFHNEYVDEIDMMYEVKE